MNETLKEIIKLVKSENIPKFRYDSDINDSDVKYLDDDICILHPECNKGILVYSKFRNVDAHKYGLKTGEQLKRENPAYTKSSLPYIFFRAPQLSNDIDYTSVETQIESLYGNINETDIVFIRIDPARTYVHSSFVRCINSIDVFRTRIPLLEYLHKLRYNAQILKHIDKKFIPLYNHYTYELIDTIEISLFNDKIRSLLIRNYFRTYIVPTAAEILVTTPHLTPDHFVNYAYH